jgi:hypothetical protein
VDVGVVLVVPLVVDLVVAEGDVRRDEVVEVVRGRWFLEPRRLDVGRGVERFSIAAVVGSFSTALARVFAARSGGMSPR